MHLLLAIRPTAMGDCILHPGDVFARLQFASEAAARQFAGNLRWSHFQVLTPAQAAEVVDRFGPEARARFDAAMGSTHVSSQQALAADRSALDAATARIAELEEALANGPRVEGFAADAEVGQIAYDSYVAQAGGVSLVTGAPLPTWDDLTDAIRAGWCAAAGSVLASQQPPLPPIETGDGEPVVITETTEPPAPTPLTALALPDRHHALLTAAGIATVEQLAAADASTLEALNGIGKATAPKLIQVAQDHLAAAAAKTPDAAA